MVAAINESERRPPANTYWHRVSTGDAETLEKNLRSLRAVRDNYASLFARGIISFDAAAKKTRHLDDVIAEGEARLLNLAFRGKRFEVLSIGIVVTSWRVWDKRLRSIVCERVTLAEANRIAEGMEHEHDETPRPTFWGRLRRWLGWA